MKLIYACVLPAALAMPGGHNGGGAHHTPSDVETPTDTVGLVFHPCEKDINTFDEQTDCLLAIYDDLNAIMDGKFSNKMKKNIGKLSEKHMDKNKTPSTPSVPTYSTSTSTTSSSKGTLTSAQATFCEFVYINQGNVKKAMKDFKKQEKMAEQAGGDNHHDFLMEDYANELVDGMLPVDMCDDFEWNEHDELTFIGSSGSTPSTPSTPSTYSSSSSEGTLTEAQAVFCEFVYYNHGNVKKAMKAFKKQEKEAEKEDGRNMHDFLMEDYANELVNGMLPVEMCDDFEWNDDGELSYMGDHDSHDHGSHDHGSFDDIIIDWVDDETVGKPK